MPRPILVSACLLGLRTRYDDQTKQNQAVLNYLQRNDLTPIPVCPEQLAGFSTPRPAACFLHGDGATLLDGRGQVVNANGEDVSDQFLRGAREALSIARLCSCSAAILKERSPSCGVHQVYLDQVAVGGRGVTSALLIREGLQILSEEDIA